MTTEQCYNDFLKQLTLIYERREAANISDWVFENITGFKRFERNLNKNVELGKSKIQKLQNCLAELLQHKPVQYVLNEAWFYKMKFYVNEDVLIPRPETEELVEWIVDEVRSTKYEVRYGELKILDIGSGSGCIAIVLKKELSNIEIESIDVSENALKVANKNANILQAKIDFLQIDFLNENLWSSFDFYDVIVSNPPYIPLHEKEKLNQNVAAFEPRVALFVESNNPFIFYEKIAKFARSHLRTNGKVYVEIHENYPDEIQEIFSVNNFKTKIKKDIYGKERMIKAT